MMWVLRMPDPLIFQKQFANFNGTYFRRKDLPLSGEEFN